MISFFYRTTAKFFNIFTGLRSTKEDMDMDYSYYLGPNYKEGYRDIQSTSTLIINHVSWIDTMNLY